ncbi:hypothetical protein FRC12_025166 [Ceratobasidium sp. 428]|nr:hypothetical protein FRC12_025166 [Ceratobasidium sp. 428]
MVCPARDEVCVRCYSARRRRCLVPCWMWSVLSILSYIFWLIFLLIVWVAMRTRNDEGDEESVMNVEHEGGVAFTRPKEQPPTRAHTIDRPAISVPSSLASTSETTAPGLPPPRYER